MKINQLGWVIAASLAGFAIVSGFQTSSEKIGFVDFKKVFDASKLKAQETAEMESAGARYRQALQFVQLNPTFTQKQMSDFEHYISEETPSAADQKALATLETTVSDSAKEFQTLSQKPNLSATENTTLSDLGTRDQFGQNILPQLQSAFEQQMSQLHTTQQVDADGKIRAAAAIVAKKQGYTIVFNNQAAVFGSNDISDAVTKQLDK